MKRLIVDTGIWYACYDRTDANHRYAERILDILRVSDIIIPFPTLYETVNTRFAKNRYGQMDGLRSFLTNPRRTYLVDDTAYKERAKVILFATTGDWKAYSLVDMIIRLMMEDVSLGPIAVLTFNVGDFAGVNHVEVIDPRLVWA